MTRYRWWHALLLSFFSPTFYRAVATQWRGIGLIYLLILLALTSMPTMISNKLAFDRFNQQFFQPYMAKAPTIMVKKGRLFVNSKHPTPYVIRNAKGQAVLIFDNTGQYRDLQGTTAVFLWQNHYVMWRTAKAVHKLETDILDDVVLSPINMQSWLVFIAHKFFIIFYLAMLVLILLVHLLLALPLALFGLFASQVLRRGLSFRQCYRLCLVAFTPPVLLTVILGLVNLKLKGLFWIYFAMALVYLCWAIASQVELTSEHRATTNNLGE